MDIVPLKTQTYTFDIFASIAWLQVASGVWRGCFGVCGFLRVVFCRLLAGGDTIGCGFAKTQTFASVPELRINDSEKASITDDMDLLCIIPTVGECIWTM